MCDICPVRGLSVAVSLFLGGLPLFQINPGVFALPVKRAVQILLMTFAQWAGGWVVGVCVGRARGVRHMAAAALPLSVLLVGLPLYRRNLDVFGVEQRRPDPRTLP